MFIKVTYRDTPDISDTSIRQLAEPDPAVEKILLVNPNCPVRIMLEYIRKHCKLGSFTMFDLCDESGALMGLFGLETFAYATERFEHAKTYYIIVLKSGLDKRPSVLPQLNRNSRLYPDLKLRAKAFLLNSTNISSTPSRVYTTASPSVGRAILPSIKESPTMTKIQNKKKK